jgi:hypothetical protein
MQISPRKTYFYFLLFCVLAELLPAQMLIPISPKIRSQQLIAGPTVLVVTTRPGQEDFGDLSQVRVSAGARLAFLHVTNGESVPADVGPWSLPLVEARRKEEALRSSRTFDGRAFFLNVPDIGLDSNALQREWNVDTIAAKIAQIIATVKPHLILLCTGDFVSKENGQSALIANALRRAAQLCAKGMLDNRKKSSSWRVQCVAEACYSSDGGKKYSLVGKSGETRESKILAQNARSSYASFSLLQNRKQKKGPTYRILEQQGDATSDFIIGRVETVSPRLRTVKKAVGIAGESLLRDGTASIGKVAAAADSISVYLREGLNRYSELDQRALILWKGDLDYFQAREAEKYIDIRASDSILTERQIFLVVARFLRPEFRRGTNQIIFHKAKDEDWIINESSENIFDLNRDSVFRVLSPEHLSYNAPVALYGLDRLTLDEPFRFSIIHQGKSRAESFIITKEISLRYSSRHASVVQTPIIPIAQSSRLVVDSYNFTRDPVDATLFVKGSMCWSDSVRFSLPEKDEQRRDTFHIHWADGLPMGDYPAEIRGSNRRIGEFTGRKLFLPPSGNKRIVLITDRVASPFDEYFRLAGSSLTKISSQQISVALLANTDVLIVDRDTRLDYSSLERKVGQWIRDGGRIIVLPQFSAAPQKYFLDENIAFLCADPIRGSTLKAINAYQESLRTSNGVVRGFIDCPMPSKYDGLLTTVDGKLVLARKDCGRGSVIVSAIDLDAWIGQAIPAGYEIFAKAVFSP